MYLARKEVDTRYFRYMLRESYRDGGILYFRDLADLGANPGRFIIYSSETSFHLDESLIQQLRDQGVTTAYSELEELFFPFVDPYIKNRQQPFRSRHKYRQWQPADEQSRKRALRETHAMDRNRLYFLRMGRASAETIEKSSALYTTLLDKSRDEIEQLIMAQEQALPPREYHHYLFAIFDLQRFFKESYARSIPQALNRERLDTLLVEELCRLAVDPAFWQGYPHFECLPPYLVRYLIMYFDASPEEPAGWARFNRSSRSRRPRGSSFDDSGRMSRQQASAIFELTEDQLAGLRKRELTRLYRQKAHELHPDKGGETEHFIRLTAAYEELLASLP
ncbi:MAG: J domain-containing protein [Desulfobulbaceae bacterium]|jgi:hypothetical protein|nr:J domain-containing protein [Desulfobulbaceae bacterium]